MITSIVTDGYLCSVAGSFLSVFLFCFFLMEPRMSFETYAVGYPVTFFIMLISSVLTGTLAAKLKMHAKITICHDRSDQYAQNVYRYNICICKIQFLKQQADQSAYCKYKNRQQVIFCRRFFHIPCKWPFRIGSVFYCILHFQAHSVILLLLMYLGRVGGLTLIYAVFSGRNKGNAKLPLEKITVG